MQARSIDQLMVVAKQRLPNLNPAEYSIIKTLLIESRTEVTMQQVHHKLKNEPVTHVKTYS